MKTSIATAILTIMLVPMAVAHADDNDRTYLATLAHFGITCENLGSPSCTDASLVQMGHAVCDDLENGRGIDNETTGIANHSNGALSQDLAMYLVSAAVVSYCPDKQSLMR
jgi:hypothetical protein